MTGLPYVPTEMHWVTVKGGIDAFLGSNATLSHMAPSGTGTLEQPVLTSLPTKRRVGVGGGKV